MDTLIMIGQFVLSLSILIILHECGHFFPARWFNTRVEKFYLFFDPWFELFKFKKGETEYGIGWLPLGGYVKISGMIDESFDKEQMAGPPQPWEFRSKKTWQRLIIMLGGVTVNFALGIILFGLILFKWGEQYLANEDAVYGIYVTEYGEELGLQNGDKVLAVEDFTLEKFGPSEVARHIIIDGARSITVERDGERIDLPITNEQAQALSSFENQDKMLYGVRIPVTLAKIEKGFPAAEAGLQVEDQIISLNDHPTLFYDQYTAVASEYKNQTVNLTYLRASDTLQTQVNLDSLGRLGFYPYGPAKYYEFSEEKYAFGEAMVGGWNKSWNFLGDQLKAFGEMFKGNIKASDSLGGPIAIATLFKDKDDPNNWNWKNFWSLTAMLSIILAFMNLLPIPALDGGHVMFLLYEMLTGRKPSDKVLEYATLAGFIILMLFMILVFGNDISRLFR